MKIDITSETIRFNKYLNLEGNNQMIFSGIFGIGKTYFLKDFFENNSDKYELFLLSPVNYSISNNDDIIDYIKYDIAFELLGKNIDYEKTDFSKLLTAQFYLKDNFLDTITLLAKNGGQIGKTFSSISENLKKLANNIKKHNSDSQIDEKKELIDFLKEITIKNHSIFEENRITELISGLIQKVKENDKETILIIDDLDRLEPEHIFRILNVFACHFDFDNFSENKFGIQKVIIVCDIENIRNLFHFKYGSNIDFSGYIDKFYSREVFYFNNKEIVSSSVNQIISSIKIQGAYDHIIDLKNNNRISTIYFKEVLEDLVNNDLLNLRTLLKLYNKEYELKFFDFKINENRGYSSSWHFQNILIFDFLISFYGSISSVNTALKKLNIRQSNKLVGQRELRKYGNLIALVDYKNHQTKEGEYEYKNQQLDIIIKYTLQHYGNYRDQITAIINEVEYLTKIGNKRIDFPSAPLLEIAFNEYIKLEKLKN